MLLFHSHFWRGNRWFRIPRRNFPLWICRFPLHISCFWASLRTLEKSENIMEKIANLVHKIEGNWGRERGLKLGKNGSFRGWIHFFSEEHFMIKLTLRWKKSELVSFFRGDFLQHFLIEKNPKSLKFRVSFQAFLLINLWLFYNFKACFPPFFRHFSPHFPQFSLTFPPQVFPVESLFKNNAIG